MKQCSQCREWVDSRAAVCKSCHHRFTATETNDAASRLARGRLIGFMIVCAGVVGGFYYLSTDKGMNALVDWTVENSPSQ
jgi:hypothetical protein